MSRRRRDRDAPDEAVIYARQSHVSKRDREAGRHLAVDRQLAMCRELCDARGWKVTAVYTDDNRSATTGKRRPAFEEMLAAKPPRIVAVRQDRLLRLMRDLDPVLASGSLVTFVEGGELVLARRTGGPTRGCDGSPRSRAN